MPKIALQAADLTLDAAAAILRSRPGSTGSPRARTIQRHCLVLCAVAWETYAAESLFWIADEWAVQAVEDGHALPKPLLRFLKSSTPAIRQAYDTRMSDEAVSKSVQAGFEQPAESDSITARLQAEIAWTERPETKPPADQLQVAIRWKLLGAPHRGGGFPGKFKPRYDGVVKTQRTILGAAPLEKVQVWNDSDSRWVRDNLNNLVDRRNAAVHSGRGPTELNVEGAVEWLDFTRQVIHGLDAEFEVWDQLLDRLGKP